MRCEHNCRQDKTVFTRTWLTLRSGLCCRKSVCRLSVTFVCPILRGFKLSSPFCTLDIFWSPFKTLWRSSQGNPSVGGVKRERGSLHYVAMFGYLISWWVSCTKLVYWTAVVGVFRLWVYRGRSGYGRPLCPALLDFLSVSCRHLHCLPYQQHDGRAFFDCYSSVYKHYVCLSM